MTSTTSTSASSPHLPTEVKGHILSFCDQSTLAKCSSLSLAFLQLSSPLLYEDVVLQGVESLHKLFCAREDPSSQPHLHPYLALTQIKKLTLFVQGEDVPPEHSPYQDPIQINRSRLGGESPSPLPLPLRSLAIFLRIQPRMVCYRMMDIFLSLVDPIAFRLEGYGPYGQYIDEEDYRANLLPLLDCYELGWRRLRHVSFKRAGNAHTISALPSDPNPSFTVTRDLSWTDPASSIWNSTRFDFLPARGQEEQLASGFVVNGLEGVEILVPTAEGREEVSSGLREVCERTVGWAGWEKTRRNIEVVVVPSST